ncbi:ADP-ribosylation factor-like protein 13B [Aphelenchoides bicaudatus]|nr:ADP-ribosylation factor-like protein 13B [Aphelenchoides bicaudatus]
MGNCVGGFKQKTRNIVWPKNRNSKTIVIAFLGLDSAGKTTIVKALQGEGTEAVHQTMGFSRGEFALNKCQVVAYDLGGAERIRDIWKIYYSEVFAIVYVVDSAATSRLDENKRIIDSLRAHPDLMYKPILFLLNKKDLPEAVDEMSFSEQFSLHTMACENKTDIRVEGVCAIKGHGRDIDPMITEGVGWLIERVLSRFDQLNKEIETALKALKERQAHERLQRQHRLATLASRSAIEENPEEIESQTDVKTDSQIDTQLDVQMEDIEPIASTSVVNELPQKHSIPNGILGHNDSPIGMNHKHGLVEKGVVEAYVEYHPEPTTSVNQSPIKTEPPVNERPKSAGINKNHVVLKRANKVVPEADIEEPVRSRDGMVDYKVFENSEKLDRRRSPLRTKSVDSKALFQQVNRPRLLMNNNSTDIELSNLRNHSNHISKDSSTLEESMTTRTLN